MLLRERMGCEVRPVVFTSGMGQRTDGRLWFVGKVDLMSGPRQARVGADGFGQHDDLVIALALACWAGTGAKPREPGRRLFW